MIFKDSFDVCVKKFESTTAVNAIQAEASILTTLNTGEFTPHCFGVCIQMRAIVMSLITVHGQPLPLHLALNRDNSVIKLDTPTLLRCLLHLSLGLQFVHDKGILHNDLKLDNVVLGNTKSGLLKTFIIDFGKACTILAAKSYKLTEEEKAKHKTDHSQVAPDLRDGLVKQSVATDVFSIGRILNKANKAIIESKEFALFIKQCLQYHSHNRPSIEDVVSILKKLLAQ